MLKPIVKKCAECKRIMVIKRVGDDGAAWEIQEEMNLLQRICWPCGCRNSSDSRERHIDLLNYAAKHPCGCGPEA